MNCKFCQAELEEGVTLCPACGQENQPEEELPVAEVTEEAAAEDTVGEVTEAVEEEAPARKKLTSGKLAVIYICIIEQKTVILADMSFWIKYTYIVIFTLRIFFSCLTNPCNHHAFLCIF